MISVQKNLAESWLVWYFGQCAGPHPRKVKASRAQLPESLGDASPIYKLPRCLDFTCPPYHIPSSC